MTQSTTALISDVLLPEVERHLLQDPLLWPNVKGFFVVTVTKKRKPATTWYILLRGNEVQPVITNNEGNVRALAKMQKSQTVKVRIEDSDLLNFITGGLTGIKGYVSRRIKIKGDLILAQKLNILFEKAGARERALDYIRNNDSFLIKATHGNSKL
ncbi:hypothetical protein BCR42DRAFT_419681 [Absidia repens]|uniref:SCP2 domain-containing protein n=1 Tax=Absidia repens TaxID=90262 RepID=A0A1X2IA62_9FUNG|nr:hypothetical protein BCR42DRAFT_419681 [Absidia repens]